MANRVLLGNYGGTPRLRVSRPGFDVTNMTLGPEKIAFDSAWNEILTVYTANWADTSLSSGQDNVTFGGYSWYIPYRELTFADTLPFRPVVMAWLRQSSNIVAWLNPVTGDPVYTNTDVTLVPTVVASYTDRALISTLGTNPTAGVAYIVCHQRLDEFDSRESAGSANRVLLGNHPTRGGGLFVSRAGANVLTAGDADLALSSSKLPIQAAEAGSFSPTARWSSGSGSTALYNWANIISLSGSYPDYPPVIIAISDLGSMLPLPSKAAIKIHWIDASTICVEIQGDWLVGEVPSGATIQYFIPHYDPSYTPPASPASSNRIYLSPSTGLKVSKPGTNVLTASDGNIIFDSNRSMMHISSRGAIVNAGSGASSGTESISTIASSMPLVLFSSYTFDKWWSSPNFIAVEARRDSGSTYYIGTQSWARVGSAGINWAYFATSQTTEMRYSIIDFSTYA